MIFNIFLHLAFVSTEQDEVQAKRRRTEKKVCQKFKQNNKRTESKEELHCIIVYFRFKLFYKLKLNFI